MFEFNQWVFEQPRHPASCRGVAEAGFRGLVLWVINSTRKLPTVLAVSFSPETCFSLLDFKHVPPPRQGGEHVTKGGALHAAHGARRDLPLDSRWFLV